jgi:hypothetical protein
MRISKVEYNQDLLESQTRFLKALVAFERPLSELMKEDKIGWADWKGYLVTLTRQNIISVLERFINGDLSSKDMQDWGEALEGRGTVQREPGYAKLINEMLFTLANEPNWGNHLTPEVAKRLVIKLMNASQNPDA